MSSSVEEELITTITEAFAGSLKPQEDEIVCGGSNVSGDALYTKNYLAGKDWQEITIDDVPRLNDSFLNLSPKAIRYYLPAFLIWFIKEPIEADLTFPFSISALSPPPYGNSDLQSFEKRISLLNDVQKSAIRRFFGLVRVKHAIDWDGDGPESTLTTYWDQFP